MKNSTSSVISTSDVSTKDRSSLTDRLTSITDEGMESVLWYIDWWVYSLKRYICPDMLSYIWACRWFGWIFPRPINDKILPSRAEVLSCKYHPGVFCHPEQKYCVTQVFWIKAVMHPFHVSVDKLPPLSTKLNLTAELEDVTVRLCDSDNSLAQIQISGGSGIVKSLVCLTTGGNCFLLSLDLISYILCYSLWFVVLFVVFYSKAATHLLCLIKGQHLTWDSFFLFACEFTHLYWFAPKTSSPAGS